jgi:hypothetical protein
MKAKPPSREDEVLLRMLKTPPKPHSQMKVGKAKVSRVIMKKKVATKAAK